MPRVLMFSIALHGYDIYFAKCLATQRAYAKKHGYTFTVVTKVPSESTAKESAWLKMPLIRDAFDAGYERVFWIDADCEVKPSTPALETLDEPGKSCWMAHGVSGRFNSGVMIFKNDAAGRQLLDQIIDSASEVMPEEDRTPYENGHVIHFAKNNPAVAQLHHRWNNNRDVDLDDYIRHYTAWPMREHYKPTPAGIAWRKFNALKRRIGGGESGINANRDADMLRPANLEVLKKLETYCLAHYPAFATAPASK